MQTVAQALQWAVAELSAVSPADDAQLDAEWLLAHLLGKNRAWLRAFAD
ncbi:MAG: protein-(glutamine-N5) methyltransferase, release factor-specific, partial [Pseudomonadota bacterium]